MNLLAPVLHLRHAEWRVFLQAAGWEFYGYEVSSCFEMMDIPLGQIRIFHQNILMITNRVSVNY